MKSITIFTPTYNRGYLLPRLYNSLINQTSQNFIWLIIDDGSEDNTRDIITKWQEEKIIHIEYHYKDNGGMHTAHNTAYRNIKTELNVCIDSDDYMPPNAVEVILSLWKNTINKDKLAGIIGLDAFKDGSIVGTKIPENFSKGSLRALYEKHKVKGDKKVVLKTNILKRYPLYPEYSGEKLVPLNILYTMIGNDYNFIYSNEIFCIVEYQPDGSSGTIFRQYKQSARGFAYAKAQDKNYTQNPIILFKNSIQIVSSAIFSKDYELIVKGPKSLYNYLMLPVGILYNLYVRYKIRKSLK